VTAIDRYPYVPITRRPRLTLPGGARLAFWVVVNHEVYEFGAPGGQGRLAWPRVDPDVRAFSHRDYGNRAGIQRTIAALDRCGVRGSLSLNVAALDLFPAITSACVERGWEVLSHGYSNSRFALGLDEAAERGLIERCRAGIERVWGRPPAGWMGPSLTVTERTFDLLAEYGFLYSLDLFHDDQPFPIRVRSGRLISVPYTVEVNDILVYARGSPAAFGRMIRDQFDVLYAESAGSARVMCVALHPFLVGQPHRIRAFEEAVGYVLSHSGVWATTGEEIARWYYDQHYDEVAEAIGL
jgi:peptidoglycan/xylan/chitin deacetylase (PgdA/CDA1 family)